MFFLAAAMIGVWLIITLYVLYMSNRQRTLEEELAALEELMQENRQARGQVTDGVIGEATGEATGRVTAGVTGGITGGDN